MLFQYKDLARCRRLAAIWKEQHTFTHPHMIGAVLMNRIEEALHPLREIKASKNNPRRLPPHLCEEMQDLVYHVGAFDLAVRFERITGQKVLTLYVSTKT